MVPRLMACRRRTLLWLLTANIAAFVLVVILQFDGRYLTGNRGRGRYQKAYDRWVHTRSNWERHKDRRGIQLDAVAGFDYFRAADGHNDRKYLDSNAMDLSKYDLAKPLDFIPRVPNFSESDLVPYLNDNITGKYLQLPDVHYSAKIAIATPACDVAGELERFSREVRKLTYPHHLVSVYFGEDSSSDRTYDMALLVADDLQSKYGFHAASAFHFNISGGVHGSWGDVHERTSQHERRSHLAQARNRLLDVVLRMKDTYDYVLWIDSDISELPRDVIQQLLSARRDVVVPACLFMDGRYKRNFDKNSWRETPTSIEDQSKLPNDVLLVEGYSPTFRLYLPDLRDSGRVVPLDGVGGCTLLVKASCHRNGLVFPEDVYRNHIETEGLAKMAQDMGYRVAGMPFVEVFH